MAIIDIYTCLAGNSAPYADMLRKNMTSLQSGRHTLRFHAMISANDAETVGIPNGWGIIPVNLKKCYPKNISTPAVNHAKLLNSIEHVIPDDSDMVVISDCDMFVYPHGWDEYLYRETREVDCIGTTKHDGSLRMFLIAFPTFVYLTLQPDFLPGVDKTYSCPWIVTKHYNRVVADTGWMLEELLLENEKKYQKFAYLSDGITGADYIYKNQLFCSHLGGSHKKDFKSDMVQKWYEECKNEIY